MFGYPEAVQIIDRYNAGEVGGDEECSGAVAATDGHGLEHGVLDFSAVADFVNDRIEHDKFRHNAMMCAIRSASKSLAKKLWETKEE